jgi:hypothetical protein
LIEQELLPLDVEGEPVWLLASQSRFLKRAQPPTGEVRLLPAFDTYLLGYARREFVVPARYQKSVFHGGELAPVVLLDGLAVGTWRYEQRNREMRVRAAPFSSFTAAVRAGLVREVADIGRFWGLPATLEILKNT